MKLILPDSRKIWIGQLLWHCIHQQITSLRRLQLLLFAHFLYQLPLMNQLIQNSSSGSLSTNTIYRLQLFFGLWILHKFMNILHGGNKGSLSKSHWWSGNTFGQLPRYIVNIIIFLHRRQVIFFLTIILLILALLIISLIIFLAGIKSLPAQIYFRSTAGSKKLLLVSYLHLGLVIGMHWIKLSHISLGNQEINIPLHCIHLAQICLYPGRNNGVMGGNFLVIPSTAFNFAIGPLGPINQSIIPTALQISQNALAILKLISRQILAIRTRIGSQLPLIKSLSRIQHLLWLIAKSPACQNLQSRKGKRQSLSLLLFSLGIAGNHPCQWLLPKEL